MSVGRESYHHGDLREALLRVAQAHVQRDGAHGLSVRGVAREVGVDNASVYRHFRGKAELLAAVGRAGAARLSDHLGDALDGVVPPQERLRRLIVGYVEFGLRETPLFRLMFGPWCAGQGLYDVPGDRHPPAPLQLGAILAELAPERSSKASLMAAWSMAHGLTTIVVDNDKQLDPAIIDEMVDILVVGLGGRS